MAAKSRKSKTQGDIAFKNKDQVRYFYYRTWHKVSKALGDLGDTKKSVQELYGLVNYSEMRKKIGFKALNPTNAPRLLELVLSGQTTIKVKGKNLRIKTPVCRALRMLNNVPDKYNDGPKVPTQITVELRPIDNAAWTHVQSLAHNPRVKISCGPQRKLASIVGFMENRWQPVHIQKKNSMLSALEGLETPQELKNPIFQYAQPQKLQIRVFPNQVLKPIEVTLADTYSSADMCLSSYLRRLGPKVEDVKKTNTEIKSLAKQDSTEQQQQTPVQHSQVQNPHLKSEALEACLAKPALVAHNHNNNNNNNGCSNNNHVGHGAATASGISTLLNNNNNNIVNCTSSNNPVSGCQNKSKCDTQPKREANEHGFFTGYGKIAEISVTASVVDEEACDGLQTSTQPSQPASTSSTNDDKDGPVGSGYTTNSLSVMTVGDFYLRLGCPETIVLYYTFYGDEYPAPENRAKSVLDKLVSVLSASVCDKKLAQPKPTVAAAPSTSAMPPKAKRDRLADRAVRDQEFAVPQGIAPRVSKKDVTIEQTIKIDLPSGNRRQRMKRKPISAMMIQRAVQPRLDPIPTNGVAPQSVPNGVVIRSIMPSAAIESAAAPLEHTQPQPVADFTIVSTVSLEALIGQAESQPSLGPCNPPEEVQRRELNQPVDDRLETPKKVFNFDEEPMPSPLASSLDFPPLLATPTKQWLNGDASNLSLGSLLNVLESPMKSQTVVPDSNSNLESKLPDVESHLQSLMNESSLDYMTKFADLAAQIARQPTGTSGTPGDL